MNRVHKAQGITPAQIRAIKTLQGKLGMDDLTYRGWLLGAFGVSSCTELTSSQAGQAIEALGGLAGRELPPYLGARHASARLKAWNKAVFTAAALRGIGDVDSGGAPAKRQIRHVAGALWQIARRARDPRNYALKIIRDATGRWGPIATAEECEAVRVALRERYRRQGPPRKRGRRS